MSTFYCFYSLWSVLTPLNYLFELQKCFDSVWLLKSASNTLHNDNDVWILAIFCFNKQENGTKRRSTSFKKLKKHFQTLTTLSWTFWSKLEVIFFFQKVPNNFPKVPNNFIKFVLVVQLLFANPKFLYATIP